ncbi:uncharacterized protein LOC121615606 [Chelmon rostratus]|uniref:uncharacterized protein LOC121615606 n=1 Tax=Chelmon rostratus TaxID=109905 RepID=UPI001BE8204B|nr:uncharacterized protein LOC121615606 [Chelmon rostratus]
MLLHLFLLCSHFIALSSMNSIKPERTEEHVAEGRNINLACKYEGAIYSIQWYRQYQRSRPEFLLSITEGGSIHPTGSGFSAHINKTEKRVDVEIISAKVTDSAVYYCALQPTVTGNSKTLHKNLCSKHNTILAYEQHRSPPALRALHWLPVRFRVLILFKAINGQAPAYIKELLAIYQPARTLRSSNHISLVAPRFVTLFLLTIRGVSCEDLSPVNNEESSLEDSTVTLSYKYSKQATAQDYFYWYRQYPGKPPEFLISHSGTGTVISNPVSRLTVEVSEDQTQMDLQISSAAVTDSALYYCAVRPTVTANPQSLYKNTS